MNRRVFFKTFFIFAFFLFVSGNLTACGPKRPLTVPTTPPSEIDENPGPDAPPVSNGSCEKPEDCFEEGIRLREEGDRKGARAALAGLRLKFPRSVWAHRSAFLLGVWSAEIGSSFADRYLREAGENIPDLEAYTLYYSGLGHFNGRRFGKAVVILDLFLEKHPRSVLADSVRSLRAGALVGEGRCEAAFRDFNSPGKHSPAEILLLKAECAEKEGEAEQHARHLQEIWFYKPGSPQAAEARRRLHRLKLQGVPLPEVSFEARLKRADYLMSSAQYKEALELFQALSSEFPGEFRDSLRIRQGEALFFLRENEKAIRLFRDLAENSKDPREVHKSLFWLARIAVRQDEDSRLMEIEQELAGKAPGSPQRIRALYYVGDAFDDSGDRENASKIYRRIMAEFPATRTAQESAWRLGWMAYRHGDFRDAIRVFRRYVESNPSDPVNGRFWYWIGRSAEKSGDRVLAHQAFRETCRIKRLSYYCQLVEGRGLAPETARFDPFPGAHETSFRSLDFREGFKGSTAFFHAAAVRKLPLGGDPGFLAAKELASVRMFSEASKELSLLALKYKDPDSILFLSGFFSGIGDTYRSMRLVRLYFSQWIEEKREGTPEWFWRLAFPSALVLETIESYPVNGLDPFLVSAVIREESAYDPNVVSRAGAIGLMQLMPYTGEKVARETGLGKIRREDLKDPILNIRLGSRYLRNLVQRFQGNWVLAVAAYNAGPEAVSKWVGGGVADLEEFVESIPYQETRNYTKRVIRSYYEYKRISERRNPQALLGSLSLSP